MLIIAWLHEYGPRYYLRGRSLGSQTQSHAANSLWSWLFFAWQLGALALAEIILLWVLIVCTLVSFWRVRPLAGVLLVPYLVWVSFATALNYALWQLNPQALG